MCSDSFVYYILYFTFLMSWAWSDWPFTQFPNCTFSVLWHCWLSHLTREWCVRELHGDKSLSPSPTVPVVPFPIPTPSPQTWPPSPPRPHRLCPHPTPSPLFLSPFPSQSPCYKISLTQCTNHQIISQYFSLANVHLTVSWLFYNIKLNIKDSTSILQQKQAPIGTCSASLY